MNLLDPQGPIGISEKTILIDCVVIMLTIIVPTILAIIGFAWWFRASNKKAKRLPHWEFSGRIEMVAWSIPVMVVVLLGGVTWIGAHKLDPANPIESKAPPLEIQVVSLDWKWLFIYPEQNVASVNKLVIPSETPIHFSLTSSSVMNAFFIPQLGSMIYTMNGMTTQLYLQADTTGKLYGLSSHFSGDGFADMHFEVSSVSPQQFENWADQVRQSGSRLDTDSYVALAVQSKNVRSFTYKSVAPNLFNAIATQKIAPAPGPLAQGGTAK